MSFVFVLQQTEAKVGHPESWSSLIVVLFAQLVQCQTLDRKVAGSNLTRGTVLHP